MANGARGLRIREGPEVVLRDGISEVEIDGEELVFDSQERDDGFDAAGGAGGVTRVSLDGGDGWNAVAKESHGSEALGEVVVGRAGAVGIDVVDVVWGESGVLDGLLHDEIGEEAVG